MNESVGFVEHLRQILTSWGLYDENSISPFAVWKFLDALDNKDAFINGFIYTLDKHSCFAYSYNFWNYRRSYGYK